MYYNTKVKECQELIPVYMIVRRFNDNTYKVIGLPKNPHHKTPCDHRVGVNEEKLDTNLMRAKANITEIALCNTDKWKWFLLLTFDETKINRYDYKECVTAIRHFFKKYQQRNGKIDYLIVGEKHKDGAFHFHALISELPRADIKRDSWRKDSQGRAIYHWLPYEKEYGWAHLTKIENVQAVSWYIQKYMDKSIYNTVKTLGEHTYITSRGLTRSELFKHGYIIGKQDERIYQRKNEYVTVGYVDYKLADAILLVDKQGEIQS